MKRKEATKEEVQLLAKLYLNDEKSNREIASAMNMSVSWCLRTLKEYGLYVEKEKQFSNEQISILKKSKWNNGIPQIRKMNFFFEEGKLYKAICRLTKKELLDYSNHSGALLSHLSNIYPEVSKLSKYKRDAITKKTGKPWYADYFDFIEIENVEDIKINCKDCEWSTTDSMNKAGFLTSHIQKTHGSILQYLNRHPEDEYLFKTALQKEKYKSRHINSDDTKYVVCRVCNQRLTSITNTHLAKHGLDHVSYKEKFGNEIVSKEMSNTLSKSTIQSNLSRPQNFTSSIEEKFKHSVQKLNNIRHQFAIGGFMYDFIIEDEKAIIEIDGSYWHGHDRDNGFTQAQIFNFMRDVEKDDVAKSNGYSIYRITEGVVKNLLPKTFDNTRDLIQFLLSNSSRIEDHKLMRLKEYDIILEKDYCIRNKDLFEKDDKMVDTLLKFWKKFYYPKKYITDCIDLPNRRQTSLWLKGVMKEAYYNSRKDGSRSLEEFFLDDQLLKDVIRYRLGLNSSNEFFDVSLRQLYKGIEVRTMYSVGVFSIKQAKDIYTKHVKEGGLVYDPYAGWGSRLLACCDAGARYIGNDINTNLRSGYKYLRHELDLVSKSKVTFRDSKLKLNSLDGKVDFIFTSPPFYNDEIYSNGVKLRKSVEDWVSKDLVPVLKNCFSYLKSGSHIVIDMNDRYVEETKSALEIVGFQIIDVSYYDIKKSHYRKNGKKVQGLITALKPLQ